LAVSKSPTKCSGRGRASRVVQRSRASPQYLRDPSLVRRWSEVPAQGSRVRVIVHAENAYGWSAASAATTDVVAARAATAARRCVVPKLRGKTVASARAAMRRAGCSSGRIRRVYSQSIRKRRVVSQTPRASARRTHGFKVRLNLSKGRRR
jgi:PASTA domain